MTEFRRAVGFYCEGVVLAHSWSIDYHQDWWRCADGGSLSTSCLELCCCYGNPLHPLHFLTDNRRRFAGNPAEPDQRVHLRAHREALRLSPFGFCLSVSEDKLVLSSGPGSGNPPEEEEEVMSRCPQTITGRLRKHLTAKDSSHDSPWTWDQVIRHKLEFIQCSLLDSSCFSALTLKPELSHYNSLIGSL